MDFLFSSRLGFLHCVYSGAINSVAGGFFFPCFRCFRLRGRDRTSRPHVFAFRPALTRGGVDLPASTFPPQRLRSYVFRVNLPLLIGAENHDFGPPSPTRTGETATTVASTVFTFVREEGHSTGSFFRRGYSQQDLSFVLPVFF